MLVTCLGVAMDNENVPGPRCCLCRFISMYKSSEARARELWHKHKHTSVQKRLIRGAFFADGEAAAPATSNNLLSF